ncbi:MAG: triphosphoribosyl-dephospho-CoA synthase MdcB [Burkholderiales bacterium]
MITVAGYRLPALGHSSHQTAASIGRLALRSLHAELVCAPKPGLVTPFDRGSHVDMDVRIFLRSILSLRHYFALIAAAGMEGLAFYELQRLGLAAEERMLRATARINTHRGAIFTLGLLAAAAGRLHARNARFSADRIGETVKRCWRKDLLEAMPDSASHGLAVAWRYGAGGARAEAALGFPTLREIGLPSLHEALAAGCDRNRALVHALFSLIAVLEDTNLLYRGGRDGLNFARKAAAEFVSAGSVLRSGWREHANELNREFVARDLSPGGSADLLAATWFVHHLGTASW